MSEEKKVGLSRREFLKDAGLVVGGATVGSMAFLGACGCGDKIVTVTGDGNGSTKYICTLDGADFASETALRAHMDTAHPFASNKDLTVFDVNGKTYAFAVKDTELLSTLLRERLCLYGTKVACDMGECGSCTVLMGNRAVYSCLVLAKDCNGEKITTIEGLSTPASDDTVGSGYLAALSNVQQRFYVNDAFQCGFCTPGFIMAGEGLLRANPNPSYEEARVAVSGHACLCGNIKLVVDSLTGRGGL